VHHLAVTLQEAASVYGEVGYAQEEEALDLGTVNMLKVFGDQSHDLRGQAPLDRLLEDEDYRPFGWSLRVLEGT
jgi:hypothetical protein